MGGGVYAYQVVPVVSLLPVSQYFNSVTTVLSLACTGLLQCDFACRAKSVLRPWICAFVCGPRFLPQAVPLPAFPQNRILLT